MEDEASDSSSKGRVKVACAILERVLLLLLEAKVSDCSSKGRVKFYTYKDNKKGSGVAPASVVKEGHFCG